MFGRHGRTVEHAPEPLLYEGGEAAAVLLTVRRRSFEELGIEGDIGSALRICHAQVCV